MNACIAPADTNLEFVKKCINQLPKNKKLSWLRADSATYQAEVFNYCEENNINFVIGGQLDKSVIKQINKLSSWDSLSKFEDVSEFIHTMTKTNKAFRVIVIRRNITPMLPNLEDILTDEEKAHYHKERYYVLATNNNDLSSQEIIKLYRQRGETSENKIKELKNGFNMDYLPSGDFISNAFYFQIGTLAYNLFILFKTILDKNLAKHTIKTIRYKLYNIAGKLISHARKTVLKVN
ncbi:MAG: IS1380 family transposase, partial [Epsilonproteobacteria bacterium]|nr:IS1380 family transposase [Campylobacterota bacterium]